MTSQEQAFRAYYGSMADAELLRTVLHKNSYIVLAQKLMDEEIERRHLTVPPAESSTARNPSPGMWTRLFHRGRPRP
jgi:hypothetical protein